MYQLQIQVSVRHAVIHLGAIQELLKLPGAKLEFKLRFVRPWTVAKETVMHPQVKLFQLRVHLRNIAHVHTKQITLFSLVLYHAEQEYN